MNPKSLIYKLIIFLLISAIFPIIASAQDTRERKEGWFYLDEHPEVSAKLEGMEFCDGVIDALTDAGANWTELWEAVSGQSGILLSHICWMIVNMPHLDRIEMTEDILLDHARFAYATRTQLPYVAPSEFFRDYILAYRIGDEPVRMWRSNIWFEFKDELVKATAADTARAINQWVYENIEVRERGFFGPRPDPWSVITAGAGTESDIATVSTAMCKTFGIPTRRLKVEVLGAEPGGRTWLEIYSDGEWLPMYPDHPEAFGDRGFIEKLHPHNVTVVSMSEAFTNRQITSRYSNTGEVTLHFTRNGEPVAEFEHFCISAWNNGAWLPLDDLGYDPESGANNFGDGYRAVLGDGFYVVQVGVRNARGDAYVQTRMLRIDPGGKVEMSFNLDIPANQLEQVDLIQREIVELPQINLAYSVPGNPGFQFPAGLEAVKYWCVFVFDPAAEPSIRMAPLVSEWAQANGVGMIAVGIGDSETAANFWSGVKPADTALSMFFPDPDGTTAQAFGCNPDESGSYATLPFVMLLSPEKEIICLYNGFNLTVKEGLSRAMELQNIG